MICKMRLNFLKQYRTMLTLATNKLVSRTVVNLSYKIIGEATTEANEPPVILLHGFLGRKKHWKYIGKTILNMTKRTVLAVDLRNHGGSPQVSSHTYDDMAADIIQLINKLHIKRASLVGHTIGGAAAMCAALIAPQKVSGIVVVEISPVSTSDHFKCMVKVLAAMKAVDFKNPKRITKAKKEAKKQLETLIDDNFLMTKILSNIVIKHDGKIGWTCNLDVLIKQFDHIISFPKTMQGKQYTGPCLLIGGQLSEYLPFDDLLKIRKLFPQATISYIANTGHHPQTEDPKSFLELIIEFIKSNH